MIVAIDPGPTQSALVRLMQFQDTMRVSEYITKPNEDMLAIIDNLAKAGFGVLVIEQIAAMGMAVGAEVFETCFWSGRFVQTWQARVARWDNGGSWDRIKRIPIKVHLCGQARAKDANIRQALIDRFGGRACIKKGGALYGLKGDEWAALAVAVTYYDLKVRAPQSAIDLLAEG